MNLYLTISSEYLFTVECVLSAALLGKGDKTMTQQSSPALSWKPLKWCLMSLIALVLALWVSGGMLPAMASPDDQAVFKIGGDLLIPKRQIVQGASATGGNL